MLERTLVGLATLSAFTLGFRPVQAQSTFKSGYYAITGGLYTECCGIAANTFSYELPPDEVVSALSGLPGAAVGSAESRSRWQVGN